MPPQTERHRGRWVKRMFAAGGGKKKKNRPPGEVPSSFVRFLISNSGSDPVQKIQPPPPHQGFAVRQSAAGINVPKCGVQKKRFVSEAVLVLADGETGVLLKALGARKQGGGKFLLFSFS